MPHPIRAAWLAKDVDSVVACFREDGVFHSPVLGGSGFIGRRSIAGLMGVIFEVTSGHEFTCELSDGTMEIHGFRTEFNGHPVTGLIQLDLDDAGSIRDLWVFVRPLTGVTAVAAAMGPGLTKLQNRALSVVARTAVRPLIGMAAASDGFGQRIARRMNA